MNGRYWVYVGDEYKFATYGIRRAIQMARLFGNQAYVVDGDTYDGNTAETIWNPAEPWRYEYA
jgi:hypothetical protein